MESGSSTTNIFTILSLSIALAAVIFGPLVQYFIAKRQFRTQTSNLIRNEWVKELRTIIGDYIAIVYHHNEVAKLFRSQTPGSILWDEIQAEKNNALKMMKESNQLRFRLMTMLNQKDETHCGLIDKMNDLRDLFDIPITIRKDEELTLRVAELITACNEVINYTYDQMFKGK